MGSRKKETYFECFNIHRIDLVYAQAKGHNEQQGFPGWALGRGAFTLIASSQRIRRALTSYISSTHRENTAHFL